MKSPVLFLLRLLAVLAVLGALAFLIVKYIDFIMELFYKVKRKLTRCCDEDDFEDIDLEEVCLDPNCPCKEDEE